jgi:aminopeptidase N
MLRPQPPLHNSFHQALSQRASVAALAVLLLVAGCGGPAGTPGAAGIGDTYYDQLGNGGYDVEHYTLALSVDPAANALDGAATLQATATQALSAFNLDLEGLTVDAVSVNDQTAAFSRQGRELTITPRRSLPVGEAFSVVVTYHGNPAPVENIASKELFGTAGWYHSPDGTINVMSEPNGAAGWFPANDHPRDKATYRFEITVPAPWVVAASGTLRSTEAAGDQTTYVWEMDKPLASYLASINIDNYVVETAPGPGGVTIRNYYPADMDEALKRDVAQTPDMLEYFTGLFGPYPFDEYGIVVTDAAVDLCHRPVGGALEAQTLTVFCPKPNVLESNTLAHELAHDWFGDSVSLKNWQDLWLKEGLATYAEWMWQTHNQDSGRLDEFMKNQRESFIADSKIGEPPPDDLYRWESYGGGALAIHALRLQVGDEVFFKILRAYLDRYRYGNAGTEDFVAVAEEVSGQELSSFFDSWLEQTQVPKFPQP